jgi:branched-chain amino acid aminotransferase
MPCYIRRLTLDGLEPVNYSADSLAQAAQYEPHDGVYTVTNTYNTLQVLKLDAHLDRMEDSAQREKMPLKLDRSLLRTALRQMIQQAAYGNVRFRITAAREIPNEFIISLEPFKSLPPEIIASGVRCITVPNSARQHAQSKTTDWMHDRQKIEANLPPGIFTALLLNELGDILEGLSSNFYAILGAELRTAGEGVLLGIAQQIVFAVAPDIVPVRQQTVNVRDLPQLSEAFITSSSRGIVPVVEIDSTPIGTGTPGAKTTALRTAYNLWVQAHLEDL